MSIMRVASAVALLFLLVMPAQAAEPLQPTGKWNVDFGDTHCIATRNYGTPKKPITLALKPSPIGDVMQVSVVRESASKVVGQYDGTLTIDASPPVKISILGFSAKTSKQRVHAVNLPGALYQSVRPSMSIRLHSSGQIDQTFALSGMGAVARALDECVADLRKVWNLPEKSPMIKQAASLKTPLVKLFSTDDYPEVAWRADVGGTVALMVLIDESGKIASCMVTEASGYASLDAQACGILAARARFNPALGIDGKPVKSGSSTRVRWQMPTGG